MKKLVGRGMSRERLITFLEEYEELGLATHEWMGVDSVDPQWLKLTSHALLLKWSKLTARMLEEAS